MHSLNLLDYADHSVKIPASILNKAPKVIEEPLWKTLFSHWFDFIVVASFITIINGLIEGTFHELLVSSHIQKAATLSNFTANLTIFCLSLFSYFFFSYFLNHGQSLGLFVIKKRIPMEEKSFSQAFKWALFSSIVCISGGLIFISMRETKILSADDYLYQNLVSEKEVTFINLVDITMESEEAAAAATYLEAA